MDWDVDDRRVRPTTRQQQRAPARPTAQVQMEARPRASTAFVLDRPSKPARLDKADTLDEDIVIRQAQSTQLTQPTHPTRVLSTHQHTHGRNRHQA